MNSTTSSGTSALPLRQRVDLAVLDDLDDLVLDRRADPGQLLRLAVERELRDRARRSRGSGSRRGGRRARGTTSSPSSSSMSASSSSWSATFAFRGSVAATPAIIRQAMRATRLPPDLQRAREPRADGARARRAARRRRPRARDRRQLAGRHRASSPTGSRPSSASSTSCTARARRASARPTSPASAARSPTGAELVLEMDCDFSHDPRDVPRLIAAARGRRPRARLALRRRAAAIANWGAVPARRSRAGGSLYARLAARRAVRDLTGGFKCFRRAVLETIDLDAIALAGLRLPDRDRPTARSAQGFRVVEVPIRFVDRERGRLEDERARSCSRRSGRCRCCGWRRARRL